MAHLHLRLARLMNRRLVEQGASLAQTRLLYHLDRKGPKRATDIAEFFGQAPRTVTEAIDGLERQGLVRRDPDSKDRRVKQVSLTDDGRRAVKATEPLRMRLVQEIFGTLNDAEAVQLGALLAKLDRAVATQENG